MSERLKLSLKDRLILRNQYLILARVDPKQAAVWDQARETVESGYEGEYYALTEWFDEPFSDEECGEVREILDMYRALRNVATTHPGQIADEDLTFDGFDGNNEGRQLGYVKFLIEEQGRWPESRSGDLNSHWPKLPEYREMLRLWKQSASPYELTLADAQRIINRH